WILTSATFPTSARSRSEVTILCDLCAEPKLHNLVAQELELRKCQEGQHAPSWQSACLPFRHSSHEHSQSISYPDSSPYSSSAALTLPYLEPYYSTQTKARCVTILPKAE